MAFMQLCLNQPPPQHIQSRLRSPPPYQFPIPRQNKPFMLSVRIVGQRYENQTDRLFFRTSVRPRDSGHS
jgi:hypothetical protein